MTVAHTGTWEPLDMRHTDLGLEAHSGIVRREEKSQRRRNTSGVQGSWRAFHCRDLLK